jgi:RNA polymerase sigma-70 factor (ECF subfamily)
MSDSPVTPVWGGGHHGAMMPAHDDSDPNPPRRPDQGGEVVPFPGADAPSPPVDAVDIGALFDAHAPYLCRVVQRLTGSSDAAEDIVQEVFILAWNRRDELEDRKGIRTWLYRVAVNHIRHGRRSYVRYHNVLDRYKRRVDTVGPDGVAAPPDAVAERRQRGALIHACVQELSEKQREVFVLYELEDLEGNEIAEILDLPVNTVWSRLRLARAAFRKHWATLVDLGDGA